MEIKNRTDAEFIERGSWPHGSFLPVKRYVNNECQCGLIIDGRLTTVILSNMFMFDATAPKLSYESVGDLVADGWVVD